MPTSPSSPTPPAPNWRRIWRKGEKCRACFALVVGGRKTIGVPTPFSCFDDSCAQAHALPHRVRTSGTPFTVPSALIPWRCSTIRLWKQKTTGPRTMTHTRQAPALADGPHHDAVERGRPTRFRCNVRCQAHLLDRFLQSGKRFARRRGENSKKACHGPARAIPRFSRRSNRATRARASARGRKTAAARVGRTLPPANVF